jgi:hypothetical protein
VLCVTAKIGRPCLNRVQTEKNSVRAYVFRFILELGHCLMQSTTQTAQAGPTGMSAIAPLLGDKRTPVGQPVNKYTAAAS